LEKQYNSRKFIIITSEKTGIYVPNFSLFLLRYRLKIMNDIFLEVLILIKSRVK